MYCNFTSFAYVCQAWRPKIEFRNKSKEKCRFQLATEFYKFSLLDIFSKFVISWPELNNSVYIQCQWPTVHRKRGFLSRPLLKIAMWRYWFRLSHYVYGGNRSFDPILRQSQWSLLYDVYWLEVMMVTDELEQVQSGTWTGSRIEIPEHSSGSESLFFFWTMNKQRIDENETTK